MTTEQTVFSQTTPAEITPPVIVSPTVPVIPPELNEFVGTGKKYASIEAALASVPHAQKHISTIEAELAAAKEELAKRRTTEDLLNELKQSGLPQGTTTPSDGLTSDKVTQLVTQVLEQRTIQATEQSNIQKVTSVLTEKFGDKAEEFYIKMAQESGLSVTNLNKLAATSPSAVLKLAGLDLPKGTTVVTKPTGTVNTQSLNNTTENKDLSSRVKPGSSTKELVNAWKIAGQKVGKQI